jgi:hypothetical protein
MKDMQSWPISYYSDEPVHSPLKVSLFTRIQEMRSTLNSLAAVVEQPTSQKQLWLKENEDFLQRILDKVTQDDPIQFEDPNMDSDMMKLLVEYTTVLHDLVTVIQSIFRTQQASLPVAAKKTKSKA